MTRFNKSLPFMRTGARERRFAGLHLSGPNAGKTACVALAHNEMESASPLGPLRIVKVYEKIGAFGSLFSDERLCEILNLAGPFAEVFVDCPLTLPPCVACTRPVCPGAIQCDDVTVAYMLAISSKVRRKGARKARPVNPQSQRLWDVMQLGHEPAERLEPSYSANLAPLVARALTLQRRLNAFSPRLTLKETQIAAALERLREPLGLSEEVKTAYRGFEGGLAERRDVLMRLIEEGIVAAPAESFYEEGYEEPSSDQAPLMANTAGEERDPYEAVIYSVEAFHAFMAAVVGAFHHAGLTNERPTGYIASEGWVYLPELESSVGFKADFFE